VLNTWGAKGVFDWRSRHHWATVGLQAEDLALGGLAEADVILAAGLDPRETPGLGALGVPVVTLAPEALGPLSERWGRPRVELTVPPLRAGLARVTQEGWRRTRAPLAPSQVTLAYGRATGAGGLVAADPGIGGYWVARTFATTGLGGAVVPARPGAAGLAAACVAVARLRRPGRPALAVVDAHRHAGARTADGRGEPVAAPATAVGAMWPPGPTSAVGGVAAAGAGGTRLRGGWRDDPGLAEVPTPDEATASVAEAADRLGVAVPVERWDPDGPARDAGAHAEDLRHALAAERPVTVDIATDQAQLARMIEVAGEIVAWHAGAGRW
jgi:hypothetical protein